MHPFRFGLLIERYPDATYVVETARKAESLGFSTFLVRDHLIDEPFGPQFAPLTTLAAVAQATRTLRIGTLVIANDFRQPAVLAKDITTLDQLSNGRVELGIGAGFLREEYQRAGIQFDSNAVRVDRLAEALPLLDLLLRGQPVTYQSQHFQLDGFVNFPPPIQQPRPPILVGGAGPRMLALAAGYAATVALLPASLHGGELVDPPEARSLANVQRQVELVRQAAPNRVDQLELCLIGTFRCAADRDGAAQQLAAQRGWEVPTEDVLRMPSMLIGEAGAMADHLQQVRDELGISYFVVRDAQINAAAEVVRRLTR
jgi:probable F420-dependent oxidoreductase